MRIKFHKHTLPCESSFHRMGKEIRDLGDWIILLWKFEFRVWLRKPYYNHLPIYDNGVEVKSK